MTSRNFNPRFFCLTQTNKLISVRAMYGKTELPSTSEWWFHTWPAWLRIRKETVIIQLRRAKMLMWYERFVKQSVECDVYTFPHLSCLLYDRPGSIHTYAVSPPNFRNWHEAFHKRKLCSIAQIIRNVKTMWKGFTAYHHDRKGIIKTCSEWFLVVNFHFK